MKSRDLFTAIVQRATMTSSHDYSYLSEVTYVCDKGYKVATSNNFNLTAKCGPQAQWVPNPHRIRCVRVTCPFNTIFPTNLFIHDNQLWTIYFYGDVITLECDDGLYIQYQDNQVT